MRSSGFSWPRLCCRRHGCSLLGSCDLGSSGCYGMGCFCCVCCVDWNILDFTVGLTDLLWPGVLLSCPVSVWAVRVTCDLCVTVLGLEFAGCYFWGSSFLCWAVLIWIDLFCALLLGVGFSGPQLSSVFSADVGGAGLDCHRGQESVFYCG